MTQTSGLPSGSEFPIGTTPVTFKYTNSNGVTDSCSFTVTVTGNMHTYYRDADGDGYGNPTISVQSCSPPPGYVANNTDCNDHNTNLIRKHSTMMQMVTVMVIFPIQSLPVQNLQVM